MQASAAISAGSPPRPRPWPRLAALIVWALGSVVALMIGFLFIPMFAASGPVGWLVTAVLAALLFGLVGLVQQAALRHSPNLIAVETARGWAGRTMLGGALGILAYRAVLAVLGVVYGDSPLLRGTGVFRPGGTEVEVATTLAGFALAGAVLSTVQWHPWADRSTLWRGIGWILSGALGWGAAGVVLWYIYVSRIGNRTVYFDDMFIGLAATLTAIFWASVVIALSSAVALKNPLVSSGLSALVCGVFIYLTLTGPVATAYKNYSEPLFTQREIHPQQLLSEYKAEADYLVLIDFSDDSSLLAATVHSEWTKPEWTWLREANSDYKSVRPADPKIVLWRVPDWKRVGVIQPGQNSTSLGQLTVGQGAGTMLVAETSPEYDRVYVRRADDRSLVTTIDFRNPPGPLPEGYTFDPGTMWSNDELVRVRTAEGKEYHLTPRPAQNWTPRNPEDFAISPDGRYIANGYDQECLLWVWTLPDYNANASEVKPSATPQP